MIVLVSITWWSVILHQHLQEDRLNVQKHLHQYLQGILHGNEN